MFGVLVRIFRNEERIVIHPPGTAMCEAFHHVGERCICEIWELFCQAEYPTEWWANPTGEMILVDGRYMEVFTVE